MIAVHMDVPDILVTIEYREEKEEAVFTVQYGGDRFDPASDGDPLSMAVMKTTAKDLRYTWSPDHWRGNEVTALIRS